MPARGTFPLAPSSAKALSLPLPTLRAGPFFVALLPPFIDQSAPLVGQLMMLVSVILVIEFSCLLLYASGGRTLSRVLQQKNKVKLMNRIAGTLMLGVAFWLALG